MDLLAGNEDAAAVYMLARRQVVTAGGGEVVDISIPAVKIAMDFQGVKDQAVCLYRVRALFHHFLKEHDREGG